MGTTVRGVTQLLLKILRLVPEGSNVHLMILFHKIQLSSDLFHLGLEVDTVKAFLISQDCLMKERGGNIFAENELLEIVEAATQMKKMKC